MIGQSWTIVGSYSRRWIKPPRMWIKARRIPGNKQGTAGAGHGSGISAVDTARRLPQRGLAPDGRTLLPGWGTRPWRKWWFLSLGLSKKWRIYMDYIWIMIWFCLQFTAIAMVKNLWNDDDQPRGHVLALASEAIWIFQHYQRVTHFYPHFEWFNVVVLMGNPLVQ